MKKWSSSLLILLLGAYTYAQDASIHLADAVASDTGNVEIKLPDTSIENIIFCQKYYNSGTSLNDLIIGRDGKRDVIYSSKDNWKYKNIDSGSDFVFGAGGNDYIEAGRTTGVAYIDGGAGNDRIYGTSTNSDATNVGDILIGGDGDDVIISGAGDDIVFGGKGDDSFYNRAENGVRDSDNLYIYQGKYSEYNIYTKNGFTYVEDSVVNRDGKDKIANGYREGTYSANSDRLQFSDGQVDIKTLQFFPNIISSKVSYLDSNNSSNQTIEADTYLSDYNLVQENGALNSSAIENAINDTPRYGKLYIDISGEYNIDKAVVINKPITIFTNDNNFTLKLAQKDSKVIRIASEDVTLDGININGNSNAFIGISSLYTNVTIQNSKIYNLYYDSDQNISKVLVGIEVIPQNGEKNITIRNNEIFNLKNNLHDQKEGSFGMARAIFIAYPHTDGANSIIENNKVYNIDAEEDDFIYIEQLSRSLLSSTSYPYETIIRDNNFTGFTRRALKVRIANVIIDNNIIISKDIEDQANYPAYSAISLFGSNTTIKNNTITITKHFKHAIDIETDGGRVNIYNTKIVNNSIEVNGPKAEQYAIKGEYRVFNYLVENNSFKFVNAYDKSNIYNNAHFFYFKAKTDGVIKDNRFVAQNNSVSSVVYQNFYLNTKATNSTKLINNELIGNIKHYIFYGGLSENNATSTDYTVAYIVEAECSGNKSSVDMPIVTITPIE